eukprot:TRINITY_DN3430_c0_g2_i1.p1 TRINITY_DN3430_c0_g2~~TRINITY_DN3430_c0_g2_i1.p1  ORF type:complete len:212 (+),score=7.41 TRINITY_DN3430_c0_g2_i1:111-746(+)
MFVFFCLKPELSNCRNKFKKDLQGRAVVNHLSSFQMEELFQKHVQNLYGKAVQDFKTFVINQFEVLNTEVDVQTLRAELRYYNSFQNYFSENPQMSSGLVAKLPEDVKYKVWSDCVDEFRRREKIGNEKTGREEGGMSKLKNKGLDEDRNLPNCLVLFLFQNLSNRNLCTQVMYNLIVVCHFKLFFFLIGRLDTLFVLGAFYFVKLIISQI